MDEDETFYPDPEEESDQLLLDQEEYGRELSRQIS